MGRGDESIQRINLALGQMWTKGKVQSQEMLQLTESGIGAWQILADKYGSSVADLQDRVTRGLIAAKDAVPALIEGMETQFGGLMEAQAKTFSGMVSNIQDTLQQELAEAGEPLFRVLVEQAQQFLDALDDPAAVETMRQLGDALAAGAVAGAGFVKFAWEWRDVILAVGIGYAALRLTQSQVTKALAEGGLVSRLALWRAMPAALTGARVAMVQNTSAQTAYQAAVSTSAVAEQTAQAALKARTIAMREHQVAAGQLVLVQGQQSAWDARSIGSNVAVTAATKALTVAELQKVAATDAASVAARNAIAVNQALAVSETNAAAASANLAVAQTARAGAWAKLGSIAGTVSVLAGAPVLMDGLARSAKAVTAETLDLGGAILGTAEAMGVGAAIGATFAPATFGISIAAGAAGGAIVGLVTNVFSMQAAMQAANADVSAVTDALVEMGVEARIADLATSDLSKEEIAAAGGFDAIAAALRAGTFSDYVAGLKTQSTALREQIAAIDATAEATDGLGPKYFDLAEQSQRLTGEADLLDAVLKTLSGSGAAWAQTQEQITAGAYAEAYASDLQTGALGKATEAAWQAVMAQGGLGVEALQAAFRMENLAGTAGFATQMILGIPKGTHIAFGTNATEIAKQIAGLIVMRDAAAESPGPGRFNSPGQIQQRINELQKAALSAPSRVTLTLPSIGSSSRGGGGGSGSRAAAANAAAQAAKQAAEAAAQKLKQDRQAQLQFSDAFGSLMQSALEGNFDQYRDKLTAEIKSLTRDGYQAAADTLTRMSSALTQASLDYSALTSKIKAAGDAEASLTKKMQDQYQSTVDLISGLGKVTDAQSFDQLAYLLGQTTSAATQYQDVLKALKDEGLSDDLWNQLAQGGPQSLGLAQSILSQGQAGVDHLNSLSGSLVGAADSMGDLVSQSMYKQGVDAMQAYIDGLDSQSAALESQLTTIANNILTQAAGAITPGNAGYSAITSGPTTIANSYTLNFDASKLGDIKSIQDFIAMLNSAPTTQLVNAAGTVTS